MTMIRSTSTKKLLLLTDNYGKEFNIELDYKDHDNWKIVRCRTCSMYDTDYVLEEYGNTQHVFNLVCKHLEQNPTI